MYDTNEDHIWDFGVIFNLLAADLNNIVVFGLNEWAIFSCTSWLHEVRRKVVVKLNYTYSEVLKPNKEYFVWNLKITNLQTRNSDLSISLKK